VPSPKIASLGRHALLALVLGICAFLLFFQLADTPVLGDEALYTQVGARALRTGQWAPLLGGTRTFAWKPPLTVWGNALGMALLGENELGARLVVGLLGLLLCAVVARFALRIGNRWTMVVAPLALVSAPPLLLVHGLRSAVPEVWLLLAVALSFFHYLESAGKEPWTRFGGLALLSMASGWTKGLVGPLIVGGTLFLVELASPPTAEPRAEGPLSRLRRAGVVAAVATVPGILFYLAWLLFSLGSVGGVFRLLEVDIGQRAVGGLDPLHLQPRGLYARAAFDNFGLFALVVPLVLLGLLWRDRRLVGERVEADRRLRLTLVFWIAVVFILFAVPQSRLPWYVYPAYPALALGVALALDELRRLLSRGRAGAALFLLLLALLGAARVRSLVHAWPELEPYSLAVLQDHLEADPAAVAYVESGLLRGPQAVEQVDTWLRFYLRRFQRVERRELPPEAPACSFVVTPEPDLWRSALGPKLAGVTPLPGSRPGKLPLFVLDLCGGRFSGAARGPLP
jgi:4-amino-4-deoxy-L-arabinose transferase-like glycosyltransferase